MRYIFCFIFIFYLNSTKAQSSLLLANFGIQQVNDKILVSWEIIAGNQCLGLQVEHSTDSINFVSVYDFQGICGAGSMNEKYDYVHSNPSSNTKNYYRLKLGGGGYSTIKQIKFIKIETIGYSIFPSPVNSTSKIYFYNNKEVFSLTLLTSAGVEVYKKNNITDSEFSFSDIHLKTGLYFFTLLNNTSNKQLKGSFVVM